MPIHKDFHYRHVLIDGGAKVIDFDEVRLGDPNLDLAHFCANLDLLAYRRHGAPQRLRGLARRFLAAYADTTGWSWPRHRRPFLYFYVYTCLKLARQLCLGFGPGPVPTGSGAAPGGGHDFAASGDGDRAGKCDDNRRGKCNGSRWSDEGVRMNPVNSSLRVGYILRSYPRLSQTFVVNEIRALEQLGVQVHIFAVTHPHEPLVQPQVAEVAAPVDYLEGALARRWWIDPVGAPAAGAAGAAPLLEHAVLCGPPSRV